MAGWISIGDADHLQQPVLAVSWIVLVARSTMSLRTVMSGSRWLHVCDDSQGASDVRITLHAGFRDVQAFDFGLGLDAHRYETVNQFEKQP